MGGIWRERERENHEELNARTCSNTENRLECEKRTAESELERGAIFPASACLIAEPSVKYFKALLARQFVKLLMIMKSLDNKRGKAVSSSKAEKLPGEMC